MRICSKPAVFSAMNCKPRFRYGSTGSRCSFRIINATAVLMASGGAPGRSAKPPLFGS
jgi:hypothetical protein